MADGGYDCMISCYLTELVFPIYDAEQREIPHNFYLSFYTRILICRIEGSIPFNLDFLTTAKRV